MYYVYLSINLAKPLDICTLTTKSGKSNIK